MVHRTTYGSSSTIGAVVGAVPVVMLAVAVDPVAAVGNKVAVDEEDANPMVPKGALSPVEEEDEEDANPMVPRGALSPVEEVVDVSGARVFTSSPIGIERPDLDFERYSER